MIVPPPELLAQAEESVRASLAGCTAAVVAILGSRDRWCVPVPRDISALLARIVWDSRHMHCSCCSLLRLLSLHDDSVQR
jgi:hypothetical protein